MKTFKNEKFDSLRFFVRGTGDLYSYGIQTFKSEMTTTMNSHEEQDTYIFTLVVKGDSCVHQTVPRWLEVPRLVCLV